MQLTDEQKALVNSQSKIVVGYASPGSGKTKCLVEKAKTYQGANKVLITTFTRKCKHEIAGRLGDSSRYDVVTLHGLALRLIKNNWRLLGQLLGASSWPLEPIVLFDIEEEKSLIEEIKFDEAEAFFKMLGYFRRLKQSSSSILHLYDSGVYFNSYKRGNILEFLEYESRRKVNGILIPEDLMGLALKVLKIPSISYDFYGTYDLVLLDESQDLDTEQWSLLEPFILGSQQLVCIGDSSQAIFGFTGGNGIVFRHLINHPDSESFPLSYNFRSKKKIVDVANFIQPKSKMVAKSTFEGEAYYFKANSIQEECDYIRSLGNEVKILARTNKYIDAMKEWLPEHEFFTLHQAKGKEWDRVLIAGVQHGLIPLPINKNTEEEVNLFFVGCSRAKKQLYLTCSKAPSNFLLDLIKNNKIEQDTILK